MRNYEKIDFFSDTGFSDINQVTELCFSQLRYDAY